MSLLRMLSGVLVTAALLTPVAGAQAEVLSTPYLGGNSNNGEVFQIQATNTLTITDFGVNLNSASATGFAIYEHVGAATLTAGASYWGTAIDTGSTTFASSGTNVTTLLPATLNISVAAGTTDTFLILLTGSNVRYTDGGGLNTVLASNSDLSILEGWGETNSFGTTDANREANVTVVYSVPEPSTWAMMILGFLGLGFMAYRKRKPTLQFA
jgi:hypothetical protein